VRDSCSIDEHFPIPTKVRLPLWAVVAANDLWVDRFSSGLNVPDAQTTVVRGSHTGILKSGDKESSTVETLLGYVKRALAVDREHSEGGWKL
jgi:hypothetical protein